MIKTNFILSIINTMAKAFTTRGILIIVIGAASLLTSSASANDVSFIDDFKLSLSDLHPTLIIAKYAPVSNDIDAYADQIVLASDNAVAVLKTNVQIQYAEHFHKKYKRKLLASIWRSRVYTNENLATYHLKKSRDLIIFTPIQFGSTSVARC